MAMFDKLKKALGFGPDNDNDELISDDPELHTPDSSPFAGHDKRVSEIESPDLDDTVSEVFTQVIAQFNNALPGFLKDSVDPEREKRQLFESLSADVKAHLRNLERNVTDRLDQAWRTERDKLQTDLRNISDTAKGLEAKRADLKQQQLSSERQKRALTERVHDLEKRILTLEAEKEQIELENKSMLNKVKVAQVYEKDCEAMREQIASLQSELNKSHIAANLTDTDNNIPDSQSSVDPNPELIEQIEKLKTEKAEMAEQIEALTEIEEQYNAMIGRMEEVEEKMAEIDEMTANKDARIASMKDQLAVAKESLAEKSKKLDDVTAELERIRKERDAAVSQVKAYEKASGNSDRDETPTATVSNRANTLPDSDDILNDTDWIVQPSGNNRRKQTDSRHDRPSRPKRNNARDDGQMSLW